MRKDILAYLEATAARVPERIAFSDENESLTFAELRDTVLRVASAVAERVQPRETVAVIMDNRSVRCVAALLGVNAAGACYAPLDPALPAERMRLIAARLRPALVLCDEKNAASAAHFDCSALLYNEAASGEQRALRLAAIRAQATADDPMAIMLTSGSTGVPKGVVQSVRSHLLYTEATIEKYGFTENTVFGSQSPFFYANSIIDIFPTLALGARTVLLPASALAFPKLMIEQLNAHKITELTMTPSSYVKIAASGALSPGCLPTLRYIVLSGEAAQWATLEKWLAAAPNARVWNFYGSTELYSVAVLALNRAYAGGERIPVGRPFDGVDILFLDDDGGQAQPGETGAMVIHTPWLAEGYYGDAERTAAVFIADPLRRDSVKRYYVTGDLGYLNDQKELVVVGRRDTQIKHMGYRMEIGEVECALRAIPGVLVSCCAFDQAAGALHAFWTGGADAKKVASALKKTLPRYALPDVYHSIEEMPYTATMKIDRRRLLADAARR